MLVQRTDQHNNRNRCGKRSKCCKHQPFHMASLDGRIKGHIPMIIFFDSASHLPQLVRRPPIFIVTPWPGSSNDDSLHCFPNALALTFACGLCVWSLMQVRQIGRASGLLSANLRQALDVEHQTSWPAKDAQMLSVSIYQICKSHNQFYLSNRWPFNCGICRICDGDCAIKRICIYI